METPSTLELSAEQRAALVAIAQWIRGGATEPFRLGGYAGTGKTTLMAVLRWVLAKNRPKWNIAFCAYTGKASQVLRQTLLRQRAVFPNDSVSTLHQLLYTPLVSPAGEITAWQRRTELPFQMVIVDEASMLTADLWNDLQRFGVPLLAVGDHGQLPPIGEKFSLLENPDFALTTIHRQAEDSPILQVAQMARTTGRIPIGRFGTGVEKINMQSSDAQLELESWLQRQDLPTLVLTGQNRTRQQLNQSVRALRGFSGALPEIGEHLICLQNDWRRGVYNGWVGLLQSLKSVSTDQGFSQVQEQRVVQDDDFSDVVQKAVPDLIQVVIADIDAPKFTYDGLMNTAAIQGKPVERTRTRHTHPPLAFDFAYALTVHKAQGSQSDRVILIEERNQHQTDEDWRRWLYTAVTRAKSELIIFGVEE